MAAISCEFALQQLLTCRWRIVVFAGVPGSNCSKMAAAAGGVNPMLVLPVSVQAFAMLSEATQVVQPLVATAVLLQTADELGPATPHSGSIGGNSPAAIPRREVLQVWSSLCCSR